MPDQSSDPRLRIPDELSTPLDRSKFPSVAPKPTSAGNKGGAGSGGDDGTMQQLVRIGTIGGNFALAVVALGLIGWAVQTWIIPSAAPWPLVGGLLAGIIVGGLRFVQDARKLM